MPNSDGGNESGGADAAPPKPPRTGSTSPSAFLEGEGEGAEDEEWDMCEDKETEVTYEVEGVGDEQDLSRSSSGEHMCMSH